MRRSSLALFAALPALALAAAAHAQPTTITVQMDEYKYTPARIELHVGQPYVFHVTNTGGKQHDLNAKAFFAAVTLAPASVPLVHGGGVELDQGASADIAFTPTKPGTYEMHCTEPLHSMLGMHGQIVVQ